MAEGGEVSKGQPSASDQMKVRPVDLNAVADLAERRGFPDKAKELREIAQLPIGTPLHPERAQVPPSPLQTIVTSEEHVPAPLSNPAKRLDTQNIDAMLNALEEAKKFLVPQGEDPGQFYYRKAMELLSQGKE